MLLKKKAIIKVPAVRDVYSCGNNALNLLLRRRRAASALPLSAPMPHFSQAHITQAHALLQVVKMMMVVVVIFAVCWLPFHVYFIVTSYLPELTNEPYIQELYLAIYWLAMSNSMYNPIIYCWMNSRYVPTPMYLFNNNELSSFT